MKRYIRFRPLAFAGDQRGIAATEFAIVGSALVLLLVGIVDFGAGYWQKLRIAAAARAGSQYAMLKGWDQTGITGAITAAGASNAAASPAPSQSCGCPTATGYSVATCGSSCTGGGKAGTYVTVNASATYTTILSYPGLPSSIALSATNVVRIN